MKNINRVLMMMAALSITFISCKARLKNAKAETAKVYGNCEKCEKTIETAANKKGTVKAVWNKDTKILSLSYDSTKTNVDAILKRIALAGYDNQKYIAPDAAYAKLDDCCKYTRPDNVKTVSADSKVTYTCPMHPEVQSDKAGNCPKCGMTLVKKGDTPIIKEHLASKDSVINTPAKDTNPISDVYSAYFGLKDALTKDDANTAVAEAELLFKAIDAVKMEKLTPEQHSIWMKNYQQLSSVTKQIKGVYDNEHQREYFAELSKTLYEVMKVIKAEYPVYFDHCPMYNNGKGADWLSKESVIKNPYFGTQMIGCGKTTETIKQ